MKIPTCSLEAWTLPIVACNQQVFPPIRSLKRISHNHVPEASAGSEVDSVQGEEHVATVEKHAIRVRVRRTTADIRQAISSMVESLKITPQVLKLYPRHTDCGWNTVVGVREN